MSYDLLAPGVQRWIDDHNWTDWTPIQSKAIPTILAGDGALLVAPTAAGKTEAAVLPIISEIARLKAPPIAFLYISPLRALINDQTRRAQNLLEENGLRVGWWHGDLSSSARKSLLASPPHALFTTPESVEVMLSSDGYGHGALLGNVRFLLIDEIHAFATDDRGAQLMSLLARLESGKHTPMIRIALSATVTNPNGIVDWMRSEREDAAPIRVLADDHAKVRRIGVGYLEQSHDASGEVAVADQRKLARVLERHIAGKRAIVFVNSRSEAEKLTFQFREAELDAMVHHGSIHKEERQRVEASFRSEGSKIIVATSTLELGIDIGDLDLVVQLGPTHTASSLLQRLGRSGRRGDAESTCIMYAHSLPDLPVALAAGELALAGDVEELIPNTAALHVLFHQVLQVLRERTRADRDEIAQTLLRAGSFKGITPEEYADLLAEMLDMGYLQRERDWLALGPTTERQFGRMNYRDFYAVFETSTEWTVRTERQTIGTIDRRYPVSRDRDTFLILGGRSWRVKAVDEPHLVLLVEPAQRVSIPKWHGLGPGPSFEVMQRAFELICGRKGTLESTGLSDKLQAERDDASSRNYEPGTVCVELHAEDTAVVTYFGTALNQYFATLLLGALENASVRSTPTDIRVRGADGDDVERSLRRLLDSPAARKSALERALPRLAQTRIGRFWPMFGPKTRHHVIRRFYGAVEPYAHRIAHMPVRSFEPVGSG
ncbi:MAG: DEAD/DEAH box helicase [Candidatus Eremiobacteraeota bacterium]|nr:DEAD/DEAH box helicase [Candidatus Eremiobacteraeota bacterium]